VFYGALCTLSLQGKFVFKNGRIYEGTFDNDRIVEFPAFDMDGITTPDITKIQTRTPLPSGSLLALSYLLH